MDEFTTRTYGTSGLDNRPLFGETSARVGGPSCSAHGLLNGATRAEGDDDDSSTVVLAGSDHQPGSGRIHLRGRFGKLALERLSGVPLLRFRSAENGRLLSEGDRLDLGPVRTAVV